MAPNTGSPDFIAQVYSIRVEDKPGSEGSNIEQYFSHPITSPFPYTTKSLLFSINQTPELPQHDLKDWAVVDTFEKKRFTLCENVVDLERFGPAPCWNELKGLFGFVRVSRRAAGKANDVIFRAFATSTISRARRPSCGR